MKKVIVCVQMFLFKCTLTNSFLRILAILSACSSPPRPGAQRDQPQPGGHPGVLATPPGQVESRQSLSLPPVLSHQRREHSLSGGAARREDTAPPGKPAARHHLPAAHCSCHRRGLGGAVRLDVPSHSKGIQRSRYDIQKKRCSHH